MPQTLHCLQVDSQLPKRSDRQPLQIDSSDQGNIVNAPTPPLHLLANSSWNVNKKESLGLPVLSECWLRTGFGISPDPGIEPGFNLPVTPVNATQKFDLFHNMIMPYCKKGSSFVRRPWADEGFWPEPPRGLVHSLSHHNAGTYSDQYDEVL